jgi:phage recombination protein Bet
MTVTTQNQKQELVQFNTEQVALIKNYLCKGINDEELKLFSAVCKKTGLDPFMKQIYAVKRKDQMTIQTSIDGYRLIAERTGRYCPGRESTYVYDGDKLVCATSYVKKQTSDGTWHEVAASAYFDEYKPAYSNQFWESKKHVMLAKCAESLALRKAFPNELSGLYSEDEMEQAQNTATQCKVAESTISDLHSAELLGYLAQCSPEYQETFNNWLQEKKLNSLQMLPESLLNSVRNGLMKKAKEYQESLTCEVFDATGI